MLPPHGGGVAIKLLFDKHADVCEFLYSLRHFIASIIFSRTIKIPIGIPFSLFPRRKKLRLGSIQPGSSTLSCLGGFRTVVSFWGQLRTNYLEFEWLVPKTGLQF